ncbi:glycoside hydrolase family 27 protein [Botryosphaeria dothidea]|uniref:Alpha-galactosidase n=1 Tax=Botryosphaeria dothidea TaxID=55169 RepID=A0A8H4N085_9PEZI|nr:glycoside hydrolase family 27 protein [Botryosphaeria dothidea]
MASKITASVGFRLWDGNSWNEFACNISERQFLTAANKFIELGFKDAGYEYVNIDDCCSAGDITCAGYPASLGNEEIDAATWAEWGNRLYVTFALKSPQRTTETYQYNLVQDLKYDNCGVLSNWTDECSFCVPDSTNDQRLRQRHLYQQPPASAAPTTTGTTPHRGPLPPHARRARAPKPHHPLQPVRLGQADVQSCGNATGSSWRMSGDITASWPRILEILNENSFYLNNVDFWGHPDADMLEVGNGDLTLAEARSHFALWAAMKSPLLIGTALDTLSQDNVDIMLNKYLIAFHQDTVYGKPAAPYKWGTNPDWTFDAERPAEYWAGESVNGTLVLILNTDNGTVEKTSSWAEVPGLSGDAKYQVTNVWTEEDLGCIGDGVTLQVEAHDTAALWIRESC